MNILGTGRSLQERTPQRSEAYWRESWQSDLYFAGKHIRSGQTFRLNYRTWYASGHEARTSKVEGRSTVQEEAGLPEDIKERFLHLAGPLGPVSAIVQGFMSPWGTNGSTSTTAACARIAWKPSSKCRFWFRRSERGPKSLHSRRCWSARHALTSKALGDQTSALSGNVRQ